MNYSTKFFIALSTLLLILFILAACSVRPLSKLWTPQHTATPNPTPQPLVVAAPEMECPTLPATWQGIKPGQSTVTDVISLVGEPLRDFSSKNVLSYPPVLVTPENNSYTSNHVFIDSNGTATLLVSWVFDVDGSFHTVAEYVQRYGTVLDRVYRSSTPHIDGLNYIYVWSHCGIAIEAVAEDWVKRTENETLNIATTEDINVENLTLTELVKKTDAAQGRHQDKADEIDTTKMLVFRVYLFEPTNYATFDEFHAGNILPNNHVRLYHRRFSDFYPESEGIIVR